ncbi:helix-turn-helix transcriptional regulator [Sphingomonas sp.]|uniref:helix-turn-helix transcriptional regulator n=1 Tax=Sphingomonas sp. TaxID=28214 RepID=UPI002FDB06CD
MRRADRLFEIVQHLRRASGPLTAAAIAAELETSRRSVYRDIAALIAQRVPIRGEAGIGYVLERGFDMPPLMLTSDEVEAVVLGAQWVLVHADDALARAAADVLAKVAAIIPEGLRPAMEDPAVITPPNWGERLDAGVDVARLRAWSLQGRKLWIRYSDGAGQESERMIWPFLVGYMDRVRVVIAWCELRQGFRMFRTDRLLRVEFREERYPERRSTLRQKWLTMMRERREAQTASGKTFANMDEAGTGHR